MTLKKLYTGNRRMEDKLFYTFMGFRNMESKEFNGSTTMKTRKFSVSLESYVFLKVFD